MSLVKIKISKEIILLSFFISIGDYEIKEKRGIEKTNNKINNFLNLSR